MGSMGEVLKNNLAPRSGIYKVLDVVLRVRCVKFGFVVAEG